MNPPPVLALGFRIFFLLGTAHAVAAMGLWWLTLRGGPPTGLAGLPPTVWHGHEMVYGFARAVVAGFLLTAVRNWTRQPTPTGWALGVLAALWLVPRLLVAGGGAEVLPVVAALDVAFGAALVVAVARPVIAARQARQAGIVAKVALLLVGQVLFFAGALGLVEHGVAWGLGTGVYAVLALVLTIARRVTMFFVRSALPEVPEPAERAWLDRTLLALFLVLYGLDVFTRWDTAVAVVAAALAGLHGARLASWWTPRALGRPLLWILYAAYAWFVVGFALQAAAPWLSLAPAVPLHAFTAGGIGAITIGMMARVSLGHTGRDVRGTHGGFHAVFGAAIAAGLVRVLVPWLAPSHTATAYGAAALLWIAAFGTLFAWGLPLWLRPRPDGQPG